MADNTRLNEGAGGDLMATDELTIAGETVKVPIVKISTGADGSHDNFVDDLTPMPVSALLRGDYILSGTTLLTPKFAYKNLTASGDIVAAVASKKIRVLAFHVDEEAQVADAVLTVEDASAGDDLAQFAGMDLQAKHLPPCAFGWFETTAGNALYGTVAGTSPNFNICVVYVEV